MNEMFKLGFFKTLEKFGLLKDPTALFRFMSRRAPGEPMSPGEAIAHRQAAAAGKVPISAQQAVAKAKEGAASALRQKLSKPTGGGILSRLSKLKSKMV